MEGLTDSFRITAALGAVDSLIPLAAQQMRMGMELGWVFEGDLKKLHENLTKIQALLREAENQPEIRQVRIKNLTSVISGAQEVLDAVRYETLRMSNEVHDQMGKKVHHFFSLFNPSQLFRPKVVHKVKHINALIEKNFRSPNDIILRPADNRVNDAVQPSTVEPTNASIDDSKIVGRDRDVSIVKDMLIGCDRQDGSRVIAIVGMAGLGKTTLAQLVYNDNKVVENFGDKRRWIDVSDDSKFETILDEVRSLTRVTSERPNTEGIVGKHLDNISGDKHLLVLDGVLDKKSVQWEHLKNALLQIDGSKGSSIILTTQSTKVVSDLKISPSLTHHLNELSGGDSWTMFRKLVFADGGPRQTPILVEIGIRIVEKCKGVPFAIKSLASLLCSSHDRSEWMSTWSSVENEARILQLLRLSFEQLPTPSLKRCFAYCAVFPKGSDIGKDELIQLWTGLGYLHPKRNLEMEDVGSDYCDVLLQNSLLKPVEMDEYKNITSFKMHDHVHDLAMYLSNGVHLTLEPSEKKYSVVEHLSLDFGEEKSIPIAQGNVDMLTTLFPKIIVDANCALAFGLLGDDVEKLPNSICKFIRLRYLDVSETSIRKLPNFITKLYSLETLKLPRDLSELPKEFHKLVSLRHCCMPDSIQSRKLMPVNIGKLTALQTLPFFVVGQHSGHRIEELGRLSKLRGRLHVYDLQHVESKEAAEKAKMIEKSNIQELGFHWDRDRRSRMWDFEYNNVLEGLQPHKNLKGLILENFGGRSFPFWMRSVDMPLLPNLVKIELRYCRMCEQIPSFGHLKLLEIIEIVELNNLKRIDQEFWGYNDKGELAEVVFPALRKLTLDGMPILNEWSLPPVSSHTAFFPCLEELNISGCPQLITIPSHLFSIHELTISSLSLSNVESGKKCHPSLTICSDDWDSIYMDPFMEDLLEKSSKSVRNLTIRGLKLRYLPNNLRNLVSLEKLEIIECSNLISDSSSTEGPYNLTSLQQLSIKGCPELTFLHEGLVQQALVTLEIDSCRNLEAVELGSCTSLEYFLIKGCPRLVSCWEKGLLCPTSLRRLEIGAFSEDIQSFPWPSTSACNANVDADIQPYASTSAVIAAAKQPEQIFMSLTSLHLWGWEKLAHLPEELRHFTSLRELSINSFHLLQALPEWLANISSLQSLEVCGCKSLTCFPSAHLDSLLFLTVKDCTLLRKRCKRGVGPEWRKIAHIPCVSISFSAKCKPETARQLK